jgi:chromosome segregation ATPase
MAKGKNVVENGTKPAAAKEKADTSSGFLSGSATVQVVLIAAILVGSATHVIRKDNKIGFSDLENLATKLAAENQKTSEMLRQLEAQLTDKNAEVANLKKEVSKASENSKLLDDTLGRIQDEMKSLSDGLTEDINKKYKENFDEIRKVSKIAAESTKETLAAKKEFEKTDERLKSVSAQLQAAENAGIDRAQAIAALETKVDSATASATSRLDKISATVSGLPADVGSVVSSNGEAIKKINEQIEQVKVKVEEDIAVNKEHVKAHVAEEIQKASQTIGSQVAGISKSGEDLSARLSSVATELESVSSKMLAQESSKTKLDEVSKTLDSHSKKLGDLDTEILDVTSKIPSEVKIMQLGSKTDKTEAGLQAIQNDISAISADIKSLKVDKDATAKISQQVTDLENGVTKLKGDKESTKVDIQNLNAMVEKLSGDLKNFRKKQVEISKEIHKVAEDKVPEVTE